MKFLKPFWVRQLTNQQQKIITPLSWKRYLVRFVLFAALLTLPLLVSSLTNAKTTLAEIHQAVSQTSDFKVTGNKLTTNSSAKSFLYRGNSFVFAFDPENKLTVEDLKEQLSTTQYGFGLAQNKWYLALPEDSILATEVFHSSSYTSSYQGTSLANLSRDTLLYATSLHLGTSIFYVAFLSFLLFIDGLWSFFLTLLFAALLCNLLNRLRGLPFKFSHTFKVVLVLSPIPYLLTFILTCIQPNWSSFYFLAGCIALLYWQTIRTFVVTLQD